MCSIVCGCMFGCVCCVWSMFVVVIVSFVLCVYCRVLLWLSVWLYVRLCVKACVCDCVWLCVWLHVWLCVVVY